MLAGYNNNGVVIGGFSQPYMWGSDDFGVTWSEMGVDANSNDLGYSFQYIKISPNGLFVSFINWNIRNNLTNPSSNVFHYIMNYQLIGQDKTFIIDHPADPNFK